MTARWRDGFAIFAAMLVLGTAARAVILWFANGDLTRLFDVQALGISLMIAFFVALGLASRR